MIMRFNRSDMKTYFEKFDYLEEKYTPLVNNVNPKYRPFLFKYFVMYERAKNHNLYNKIDYNIIKKNIDLIYNNKQEAEDFIFFYDFALSQLIDCYLNITSLDKLFSHHYFEFEWQQHINFDFNKNNLSFYRDHFIHQIRNCYMILKLLEDSKEIKPSYLSTIIQTLKTRNTDLSKYINVHIEQYQTHVHSTLKGILNNNMSRCCKTINGIEDEIDNIIKNTENFSWEYFIRGCLIIATLFHDIGYPIVFMNKQMNRLNDYMSSVFPLDSIGFWKLNDLIENSLLFTITDKNELKRKYEACDHGAWSAYILLLQFYETGAVRELNPIKRAMIECAAVAIYEHTIKYQVSGEKEYDREKASFVLNPLSFTLRMIDDLQEWDRIYFEIRTNSDLRYCSQCKMPISRFWNYNIERYCEDLNLQDFFCDNSSKRIYVCGCSTEYTGSYSDGFYSDPHYSKVALLNRLGLPLKDIAYFHQNHSIKPDMYHNTIRFNSGMFENGALFPYQKINYTVTSRNVNLVRVAKDDLQFYIDYDPFRLLYLLSVNTDALEYRIRELAKLNKLFSNQSDIFFSVKTNLTDNPFMLKARVLCNFLYEVGHYINNEKQDTEKKYKPNLIYHDSFICENSNFTTFYKFAAFMKQRSLFVYDYSDEKINIEDQDSWCNNDKNKVEEIVDAFIDKILYRTSSNFINNIKNSYKIYFDFLLNDFSLDEQEKIIGGIKYINDTHKNACRIILLDAFKQMKYLHEKKFNDYYEYRAKNKVTSNMSYALKIFLNKQYYDPRIINSLILNKNSLEFFDFYSDLYLFKEMYKFSMDNLQRRMITTISPT